MSPKMWPWKILSRFQCEPLTGENDVWIHQKAICPGAAQGSFVCRLVSSNTAWVLLTFIMEHAASFNFAFIWNPLSLLLNTESGVRWSWGQHHILFLGSDKHNLPLALCGQAPTSFFLYGQTKLYPGAELYVMNELGQAGKYYQTLASSLNL